MTDVACACGTCGNCTGIADTVGVAEAVAYRHSAIKQRLLDRIAAIDIDGTRPLASFGTRADDDPAIALIDAFAGSLHILAWNMARLSDDGSILRTTDPDAITDLVRLLGYEPRPALSATTTLSFTLSDRPGAPEVVTINKGTKVASVPGQNELPLTFETDADLEAHVECNMLAPALAQQQQTIAAGITTIAIFGTDCPVKVGDVVLIAQPGATALWLSAKITNVDRQATPDPARIVLGLADAKQITPSGKLRDTVSAECLILLGQRAAPFGAVAPNIQLLSNDLLTRLGLDPAHPPSDWPLLVLGTSTAGSNDKMDLDAVYADALTGRATLLAFLDGTTPIADVIIANQEGSRTDYGLSGKVSQITLGEADLSTSTGVGNKVRGTIAYIETAQAPLLVTDEDEQVPDEATPDTIVVNGAVSLPIGRTLIVSGQSWTDRAAVSEPVTVKSCVLGNDTTTLVFETALANRYHSFTDGTDPLTKQPVRTMLALLANSIGASHGETPTSGAELIGSGDASVPNQRFELKRSPLSYVPAATLRGYAPAICVRVDDRLYSEKPSLFDLDPAERAYTVKPVRDGVAEVQLSGRLPTSTHNVTALYRTGAGSAGNLATGRVTTAMAPVLGVQSVTNAVAADGGSDAETIDDMRRAAPQSIRTLDRVVSLEDFEAYARTYRGVGKALATELHIGMRAIVCLTIATTSLTSPDPGSDVVTGLTASFAQVAVPGRTVKIQGFTDITPSITIAMIADPSLPIDNIRQAVRAALGTAYGRSVRNFGEALTASAVLATVQGVAGVIAATLPVFTATGSPMGSDRLFAPAPSVTGGVIQQAGLLAIDPDQIQFTDMTP